LKSTVVSVAVETFFSASRLYDESMVEVERAGALARIFLNRPEKANALNSAMLTELGAAVRSLAGEELRAAVLTARGKTFCGGADTSELKSLTPANAGAFVEKIHNVCQAIRALPIPVLAQMHGAVIGAGLEIAAACDLRVAAEGTKFAMPEVRLGIPSVVEAALLPRLIGWGRTRELLLCGENIDAETALRWGLIERLVEPAGLDEAVEAKVRAVLAAGARAVRLQKKLIREWEDLPVDEAVAAGIRCFVEAWKTDEPARMMATFVNRRRTRD
jgi:enoyl-CoA hydratase